MNLLRCLVSCGFFWVMMVRVFEIFFGFSESVVCESWVCVLLFSLIRLLVLILFMILIGGWVVCGVCSGLWVKVRGRCFFRVLNSLFFLNGLLRKLLVLVCRVCCWFLFVVLVVNMIRCGGLILLWLCICLISVRLLLLGKN